MKNQNYITITTEAATVEPLCSTGGPDNYPVYDITLTLRGVEYKTQAWGVIWREMGPNRSDNGQYIGQGWQTIVDYRDGQDNGRASADVGDAGSVIIHPCHNGASVQSITLDAAEVARILDLETTEDDEEMERRANELAEAIQDALYDAPIDVEDASDEDIYDALVDSGDEDSLDPAERCVGGNHLGQPLYAWAGDESQTVYESAKECIAACVKHLAETMEDYPDSKQGEGLLVTLEGQAEPSQD